MEQGSCMLPCCPKDKELFERHTLPLKARVLNDANLQLIEFDKDVVEFDELGAPSEAEWAEAISNGDSRDSSATEPGEEMYDSPDDECLLPPEDAKRLAKEASDAAKAHVAAAHAAAAADAIPTEPAPAPASNSSEPAPAPAKRARGSNKNK